MAELKDPAKKTGVTHFALKRKKRIRSEFLHGERPKKRSTRHPNPDRSRVRCLRRRRMLTSKPSPALTPKAAKAVVGRISVLNDDTCCTMSVIAGVASAQMGRQSITR